jgi:hypothetical protein
MNISLEEILKEQSFRTETWNDGSLHCLDFYASCASRTSVMIVDKDDKAQELGFPEGPSSCLAYAHEALGKYVIAASMDSEIPRIFTKSDLSQSISLLDYLPAKYEEGSILGISEMGGFLELVYKDKKKSLVDIRNLRKIVYTLSRLGMPHHDSYTDILNYGQYWLLRFSADEHWHLAKDENKDAFLVQHLLVSPTEEQVDSAYKFRDSKRFDPDEFLENLLGEFSSAEEFYMSNVYGLSQEYFFLRTQISIQKKVGDDWKDGKHTIVLAYDWENPLEPVLMNNNENKFHPALDLSQMDKFILKTTAPA